MRKLQYTMLLLSLLTLAGVAQASDVQVGVTVAGEVSPGVYGRIDIGTRPPPPVVYTKPIVVVQQPAVVQMAPVYMHVPPGHAKKWSKHCHKYNACAQPVYFVRSAEYEDHGRQRGREHEYERERGREHGHGRGKEGKGRKD